MRHPDDRKLCPSCKETLPYSDFYDRTLPCGKRVLSGYCRPCTKKQAREWVEKNPERAKARWARNWRCMPRAMMSEEQRAKVNESALRYVRSHPEQAKSAQRAYRERLKAEDPVLFRVRTAICNNRTRARKKGVPSDFTIHDWAELMIAFDEKCAWCGNKASRLDLDHIHPINLGGADTVGNIVPVCRACNAEKSGGPAAAFAKTIGADLPKIESLAKVRTPIISASDVIEGLDEVPDPVPHLS